MPQATTVPLPKVRSALRAAIFDRLNDARIEIVSPAFMNQRPVDPDRAILASRPVTEPDQDQDATSEPEGFIFDKAEAASALEELRAEHKDAEMRLETLEEQRREATETDALRLDRQIAALQARVTALAGDLEERVDQADQE